MPDAVNQLLATEAALDKLGARGISVVEAEQTIWTATRLSETGAAAQSGVSPMCEGS